MYFLYSLFFSFLRQTWTYLSNRREKNFGKGESLSTEFKTKRMRRRSEASFSGGGFAIKNLNCV